MWTYYHNAATTYRSPVARWQPVLFHALLIAAVLLLPVQARAGASNPHPHALVQLLLDASDGAIDHHSDSDRAGDGHASHAPDASGLRAHDPDKPSFEKPSFAASSLAVLAVSVIMLGFLVAGARGDWAAAATRRGRVHTLEPPPPRRLSV